MSKTEELGSRAREGGAAPQMGGSKRLSLVACRLAGLLMIAALASAPARANDGSAELATGGLVFMQNPYVQMRSELVAFPTPGITFTSGDDENISIPTQTPENMPENFLAFSTTADGRPVTAQVEQKVFAKGVDQTALLRRLNIPLVQTASTDAALTALPQDKRQQLIALGLAEVDERGPPGR